MKIGRTMKVSKRDGTVEPFNQGKVRRCIALGCQAVGVTTRVADSLARAVAIHLRESAEPGLPTTEYIFRCVRAALEQTEFPRAARVLMQHRRWRDLSRESIRVFDARRPERPAGQWRKTRVVRTLERRYRLSPSTARILAGELEERVLGLRYQMISTALLGELIRNELRAWGLLGEVKHAPAASRGKNDAAKAGVSKRK
ncbi:MAG: hypothetical protein D6744_04830 [Planctomycetota bacterium]|nr:MAG: hypothetical protein D6744_04830 [Planctomycetota bacterium]